MTTDPVHAVVVTRHDLQVKHVFDTTHALFYLAVFYDSGKKPSDENIEQHRRMLFSSEIFL